MLKYKLLLALSRIGVLKHFNFDVIKKIGDQKFVMPISEGNGYQNLVNTEGWSTDLYRLILTHYPGWFIDVGFNNGQTLLKVAAINRNQPYIGFEPNPVAYNYSRKLLKKNLLSTFLLVPVGLHFENKIVELFHDTEYAAGASILANFRVKKEKYHQVQHVSVMVGDEILAARNINEIAIIKADVEGVELEVMTGLQQTLRRSKPAVLLEILPVYDTTSENGRFRKKRQDQLLNLMGNCGYAIMRVNQQTGGLTLINKIEVHGDMLQTNYLFIHKSNMPRFCEINALQSTSHKLVNVG